jgi:hypothetical protein
MCRRAAAYMPLPTLQTHANEAMSTLAPARFTSEYIVAGHNRHRHRYQPTDHDGHIASSRRG